MQFNEEVKVKVMEKEPTQVDEVDETKIDRLLHLLQEADPQTTSDSDELLTLEGKARMREKQLKSVVRMRQFFLRH